MADNQIFYGAPPISLIGPNNTDADTQRAEAVVAALEIIRVTILKLGQPNVQMKKLSEYADKIEAALKSRQDNTS